jgi:hypothetical protein
VNTSALRTRASLNPGAGLRHFALIAVVAAAGMVATLCMFAARLHTNALWQDHADTLIVEMVGRDLASGGSFLDWRLTQAPYLLPDIAAAMFVAPLADAGQVGKLVQFALLAVGALAWHRLARRLGLASWASLLIAALFCALYALSFVHVELRSTAALYFGLPGHHSSIAATIPIALLCVLRIHDDSVRLGEYQSDKSSRPWSFLPAALCWLLLVGLTLSDGSFSVAFIGPAMLLLALGAILAWRKGEVDWTAQATCSALLAGVLVAAEAFHRALPFPQKNEFFKFIVQRVKSDFPAIPLASARGIAVAPFESPVTFGLYCLAGLSTLVLIYTLSRREPAAERSTASGRSGVTGTLLLALLAGVALLPFSQIVLGLWVGPDAVRQFAWTLVALPLLAAILLLNWRPRFGTVVTACTTVVIALSVTWIVLDNRHPPYQSRFAGLAACLLNSHPTGFHFVGDFWDVLPLTAHSQGRLSGLVVAGSPASPTPFTNGQKITRLRLLEPTFALVKPGAHAQGFVDSFGMPSEREHCGNSELELWDYGANETFRRTFRQLASRAY